MSQVGRKILGKMLERLFAAIVNGPALNCRPHHSRQRIDVSALARLKDVEPAEVLRRVLSEAGTAAVSGRVAAPPAGVRVRGRWRADDEEDAEAEERPSETPEQAAARRAWEEQQGLLSKLRTLVDEARTYEDDTGVWVLNVGFPLLSLPPGTAPGRSGGTRRVLAPVALVPVSVTVRTGAGAGVEIECRSEEADRVAPNEALLSWLEQQTGKVRGELFADEEGSSPWKEIAGLVRYVAGVAGVPVPECFVGDEMPKVIPLGPAPRSEEAEGKAQIVTAAVMGLYPISNQGLLRDTREMIETGAGPGPVESFLRADATLAVSGDQEKTPIAAEPTIGGTAIGGTRMADERLVAAADPCQARAVGLARTSAGLVIHGPPGTGKSQTITNIIGDHLARGERVLFVCDKRTALDVVASRLEHLGLSELCAVVHDPQRDQRELYRSIREQLERLPEAGMHARAEKDVEKIDAELDAVLGELRVVYAGLMRDSGDGPALHGLVGRWLGLSGEELPRVEGEGLKGATLKELEGAEAEIGEVLGRAVEAGYAGNPWAAAAGVSVEQVVSRPMDQFRAGMGTWEKAAGAADGAMHETIPAFAPEVPLEEQAAARERLAGLLEKALGAGDGVRGVWAGRDAEGVKRGRRILGEVAGSFDVMRAGGDAELWAIVRSAPPQAGEIAQRLGALEAYLVWARAWWRFIAFGRKGPAAKVLTPLGLPTSIEGAERARKFYTWLRALRAVADGVDQLEGRAGAAPLDAEALEAAMRDHAAVVNVMLAVSEGGALGGIRGAVAEALKGGAGSPAAMRLAEGLARSRARAEALAGLESAAKGTGLVAAGWLRERSAAWRGGALAAAEVGGLREKLPTLEDVLRVRMGLERLPKALAGAAAGLVAQSAEPERGLAALHRGVTEAEITRRLDADPALRALDGRRMKTLFSRHAELEGKKRERVRDAIVHRWVSKQRERLLASTGSRLNSQGAEVKRRLAIRGRRAMRLRQVLAMGRGAEGGDPLMDLRPVWMASPETVAQVFPRERVFDVVVFDEASQCRLEEALPVLTRAARVVIAGDPKQLPPTRFFESAVATSDGDEVATDQDLFETQQAEVEDLLGAALGLDVQQSYLDVHYRSRNSDLIAFSNDAFYGARLQPIPGHPRSRARFAPITLYRASGVYHKRENEAEAEQVCRIIHDLLRRAEPPSIGVGCFNIAQRDLIVERLEEMAAEDAEFGKALAAARERRGEGSAEHLFVKNLENVQGDERDHIIISTTYGPDRQGRFYRRFGPLGMPGGGRRLNVLVTRARQEVHLVTSIPAEAYRALPPVPAGQQAGGGWLLFSYLKFAEELGARYEAVRDALEAAGSDQAETGTPALEQRGVPAEAIVNDSRSPSAVAAALGRSLEERGLGSIVHWGNDGFCVDVAVRHPTRPEDVTVGVLCDLTRFPQAADPVEWDLFRTAVLESQGWALMRVWSPVVFRDAKGTVEAVVMKARAEEGRGEDPDAIRVR